MVGEFCFERGGSGELPLEIKGLRGGVAKQNRVFYVGFAMAFYFDFWNF